MRLSEATVPSEQASGLYEYADEAVFQAGLQSLLAANIERACVAGAISADFIFTAAAFEFMRAAVFNPDFDEENATDEDSGICLGLFRPGTYGHYLRGIRNAFGEATSESPKAAKEDVPNFTMIAPPGAH